jgi:hypothetical protein
MIPYMNEQTSGLRTLLVLLLVCLTGAAAGTLAFDFIWQKDQRPKGATPVPREDTVLAKGDRMPELKAQGWLNGPPARPGEEGANVLVLDFWAHW